MADQILLPQILLGADGAPVSGAEVFVYDEGTSTPKTVYTDEALTTPHATPIEADGDGAPPAIFLSGTCKVDAKTPEGVSLPGFPRDNYPTTPTTAGAASLTTFDPTSDRPETTVQDAIVGLDTFVRTGSVLLDTVAITSATASVAKDIPEGYNTIRLEFWDYVPATSNSTLLMRCGVGGSGGSFTSSSTYDSQRVIGNDTTLVGGASTATGFELTAVNTGSGAYRGNGTASFFGLNTAGAYVQGHSIALGVNNTPTSSLILRGFRQTSVLGEVNAVQFLANSGNIASLQMRIFGTKA